MFVRQKRLKRLIGTSLILTLILFSCFLALPLQSSAAAEVKPGVLIVAHGTNDPTWTTPVWEAVYELRDNLPLSGSPWVFGRSRAGYSSRG